MENKKRKLEIKRMTDKNITYCLYLEINDNLVKLDEQNNLANLCEMGSRISNASGNITIIKDNKEKIIWASNNTCYIDRHIFNSKFKEMKDGVFAVVGTFMNELDTYDKPALNSIGYVFDEFEEEMKYFLDCFEE